MFSYRPKQEEMYDGIKQVRGHCVFLRVYGSSP
jgi:hypothetical protein